MILNQKSLQKLTFSPYPVTKEKQSISHDLKELAPIPR
jgi:hypothetical protein